MQQFFGLALFCLMRTAWKRKDGKALCFVIVYVSFTFLPELKQLNKEWWMPVSFILLHSLGNSQRPIRSWCAVCKFFLPEILYGSLEDPLRI